ncbi:hypothetical protein GY26_12845 [Gammaproteobacteria bacterium MFB021]|nr:hypothetical protein GY26_12845 [Gammaproteobacteria bacterium MFB021]
MPLAVLGLGSSIERERHLVGALDALAALASPATLRVSRVFESPPVGFSDPRDFYNLVVAFDTSLAPAALNARCKAIEQAHGRPAGPTKQVARTLDIDLLLWGEACGRHGDTTLPRADIERYAFVLHPLAELLPDHRHPARGLTFAELWARFDARAQPHWAVAFTWHDREISAPD